MGRLSRLEVIERFLTVCRSNHIIAGQMKEVDQCLKIHLFIVNDQHAMTLATQSWSVRRGRFGQGNVREDATSELIGYLRSQHCASSRAQWQAKSKPGSISDFGRHIYRAAMQLH